MNFEDFWAECCFVEEETEFSIQLWFSNFLVSWHLKLKTHFGTNFAEEPILSFVETPPIHPSSIAETGDVNTVTKKCENLKRWKRVLEHPLLRAKRKEALQVHSLSPPTGSRVVKGSRRIYVQDQTGFRIGRIILIHDLFAAQIDAYGSIVLDRPVDRDYPVGSTVRELTHILVPEIHTSAFLDAHKIFEHLSCRRRKTIGRTKFALKPSKLPQGPLWANLRRRVLSHYLRWNLCKCLKGLWVSSSRRVLSHHSGHACSDMWENVHSCDF